MQELDVFRLYYQLSYWMFAMKNEGVSFRIREFRILLSTTNTKQII